MIKNSAFLTLIGAFIATFCTSVHPQNAQARLTNDSNREISSVDASSHAAVDDRPLEPQPSQGVAKPSAIFSSWSLQPVKESSATFLAPPNR